MFESLFPGLGETITWILVDLYGWLLFAGVLIYIGYETWMEKQQEKFLATIKWVFLEVRVDELNERSPIGMEQVFSALHAMSQNFSMGEKWTGKTMLHLSAEIVSIGGRVSYIFKVPERFRNLLESAIFAQYPKSEIREVQDYLANLPRAYTPGKSDFEMWGTQMIKRSDSALPIRTYRFKDETFEHSAQKTTVDSMSNIIEALSNIMPHELEVIQIVLQPSSEDWKKKAEEVVAKMKGLPAKPKSESIFEQVFISIPGAVIGALVDALQMSGEAVPAKKEDKVTPAITTMSDFEKGIIGSVVGHLSKLSFKVKIRVLYLAPKDKYNNSIRIPEMLGAFRAFESTQLNGFKPDAAKITTQVNFKLYEKWERPWMDYKIVDRKNKFLRAIKDRSMTKGSGGTILTTEELATIFHFPQVPNARVSQIERVHTVKSAPPMDLPVG